MLLQKPLGEGAAFALPPRLPTAPPRLAPRPRLE